MSRALLNAAAVFLVLGWFYAAVMHSGEPRNPLSRTKVETPPSDIAEEPAFDDEPDEDYIPGDPTFEDVQPEPGFDSDQPVVASKELLASIKDYVDTPKGALDWTLFGQTKQKPYSYLDKDGRRWTGSRPEFPDKLKKFDGKEVRIKGFIFPLGQEEKQRHFVLGPFPVSCPFHYDVTPSLLIEVHAEPPVAFSYDAVDVKGQLELVPKDDEYNVYYRLKKAKRVR